MMRVGKRTFGCCLQTGVQIAPLLLLSRVRTGSGEGQPVFAIAHRTRHYPKQQGEEKIGKVITDSEETFSRYWKGHEATNSEAQIECYTRAIAGDPNFVWSYIGLATVYSTNDLQKAEKTMREAVRRVPGDSVAQAYLGRNILMQSRYAEAEVTLKEALRLGPDRKDTWC